MSEAPQLRSATQPIPQKLAETVQKLKLGQRIRIKHIIRVGTTATWDAVAEGTFRSVKRLVTGLATDRVPEDDVIVITVHFTKDNGELSSITLDENSTIEIL